jgi:hypothetical protein
MKTALNFHTPAQGVAALARQDFAAGRAPSNRYCAMCNAGEEELADLYSAEFGRLQTATTRRVGSILVFA